MKIHPHTNLIMKTNIVCSYEYFNNSLMHNIDVYLIYNIRFTVIVVCLFDDSPSLI